MAIENDKTGGRKIWMCKGPCLLKERQQRELGNTKGKQGGRVEGGRPSGAEASGRRKWDLGSMALVEPL